MKTIASPGTVTIQLPVSTYRKVFRAFIFGILLGYGFFKLFMTDEPGKAAEEFTGPANDNRIDPATIPLSPVMSFPVYIERRDFIYIPVVLGASYPDPYTIRPVFYPGTNESYQAYNYFQQEQSRPICSHCQNNKKMSRIAKQLGTLMNGSGPGSWQITRDLLKKVAGKKRRMASYESPAYYRRADGGFETINKTAVAPSRTRELSRVDSRVSPGSGTENSNCKTYY